MSKVASLHFRLVAACAPLYPSSCALFCALSLQLSLLLSSLCASSCQTRIRLGHFDCSCARSFNLLLHSRRLSVKLVRSAMHYRFNCGTNRLLRSADLEEQHALHTPTPRTPAPASDFPLSDSIRSSRPATGGELLSSQTAAPPALALSASICARRLPKQLSLYHTPIDAFARAPFSALALAPLHFK